MRRNFDSSLLVTSWSPAQNQSYKKTGRKPKTLTEVDVSFNRWLRNYCDESPLYMKDIASDMGISMSSLGNYLYKGKLPSYPHFMSIVRHVAQHTKTRPETVYKELFHLWNSEKK
jgi:hypothetical protein